ncbi:hypothetical protein T492DRAFT_1150729 [Pavlovales sp. CCMP2436]|nr:hypothetical protein T492DRAFT_1150729 [Pavlovales sp. CCMP2436]
MSGTDPQMPTPPSPRGAPHRYSAGRRPNSAGRLRVPDLLRALDSGAAHGAPGMPIGPMQTPYASNAVGRSPRAASAAMAEAGGRHVSPSGRSRVPDLQPRPVTPQRHPFVSRAPPEPPVRDSAAPKRSWFQLAEEGAAPGPVYRLASARQPPRYFGPLGTAPVEFPNRHDHLYAASMKPRPGDAFAGDAFASACAALAQHADADSGRPAAHRHGAVARRLTATDSAPTQAQQPFTPRPPPGLLRAGEDSTPSIPSLSLSSSPSARIASLLSRQLHGVRVRDLRDPASASAALHTAAKAAAHEAEARAAVGRGELRTPRGGRGAGGQAADGGERGETGGSASLSLPPLHNFDDILEAVRVSAEVFVSELAPLHYTWEQRMRSLALLVPRDEARRATWLGASRHVPTSSKPTAQNTATTALRPRSSTAHTAHSGHSTHAGAHAGAGAHPSSNPSASPRPATAHARNGHSQGHAHGHGNGPPLQAGEEVALRRLQVGEEAVTNKLLAEVHAGYAEAVRGAILDYRTGALAKALRDKPAAESPCDGLSKRY